MIFFKFLMITLQAESDKETETQSDILAYWTCIFAIQC